MNKTPDQPEMMWWPDQDGPRRLTAAELSILRSEHAPVHIPPCRVCGAELEIGSMGGGRGTKYACSSVAASTIKSSREKGAPLTNEEREAASNHYGASAVHVSYHGDPSVVAVIDELVERRTADGEDMTVPVGMAVLYCDTDVFPNVHHGDGVWARRPRCLTHGILPKGKNRCTECAQAQ